MRKAIILFKNEDAGVLTQLEDGSFSFCYNNEWIINNDRPSISLTLPKTTKEFHSKHLFSFFYNMLPEGSNKLAVCKLNRIDEQDDFGILLTTARMDNIGAVRVIKIENDEVS
jgi:serine/threonine-protein kinase HipA